MAESVGSHDDSALLGALAVISARGAIGEASLPGAVAHAQQFVDAIPISAHDLVDLGSGGGLPGLVIASRRPDLAITLVERRRSRADLLQRAVRTLGMNDRVTIVADDVREVAKRWPHGFDVVTARSFGAPAVTVQWAGRLLRPAGYLVVSEPPVDDPERWDSAILTAFGLLDLGRHQGVRVFRRP